MDDWTESQWKGSFHPSLGWQDVDPLLPDTTEFRPFYPHLGWQDINASVCTGGGGPTRPESGIVYP